MIVRFRSSLSKSQCVNDFCCHMQTRQVSLLRVKPRPACQTYNEKSALVACHLFFSSLKQPLICWLKLLVIVHARTVRFVWFEHTSSAFPHQRRAHLFFLCLEVFRQTGPLPRIDCAAVLKILSQVSVPSTKWRIANSEIKPKVSNFLITNPTLFHRAIAAARVRTGALHHKVLFSNPFVFCLKN